MLDLAEFDQGLGVSDLMGLIRHEWFGTMQRQHTSWKVPVVYSNTTSKPLEFKRTFSEVYSLLARIQPQAPEEAKLGRRSVHPYCSGDVSDVHSVRLTVISSGAAWA